MGKHQKTIQKILNARTDTNIRFADVYSLLIHLGFEVRIKGSHHIFRKENVKEMINLQKDGNKTKPYQIRQIRAILTEYNVTDEDNG